MIRIMAGVGLAAIMLFTWLGQATAGTTSGESKKDDEMEVKKARRRLTASEFITRFMEPRVRRIRLLCCCMAAETR